MKIEEDISTNNKSSYSTKSFHKHVKKSTFHKTKTQAERQLLHPLELNDKLAFETIKTVRLDFLTNEARAPIPRCQALPPQAFGRLTGRSILVSLSHGWFFQTHPDPYGEKLDMIRNVFAPQLRERYPHTDIQVFFDYTSLPQEPRTEDEDEIYLLTTRHISSLYLYADVILFLAEMELPEIDNTVYTASVDVCKYEFCDYIDTVQVLSTTSTEDGPQVFDCILTCGSLKISSWTQMSKYVDHHTFTYHRRPFGRLNTMPEEKRGWLYCEQIVVAMKTAAADKSQFDDIVVSNSEELRLQIYKWSERLRDAASKQKSEPRALPDLLNHFDGVLKSKCFSFSLDKDVVCGLMKKPVSQFASNWKGEVEKQKSMSKRAQEILLRWGEFSEQYVERAGFFRKDNEIVQTLMKMVLLLVCPVLALWLFWFDVTEDPSDGTTFFNLIFIAVGGSAIGELVHMPLYSEFLGISPGIHNILSFGQGCLQHMFFWTLLSMIFGVSLVPYNFLWRSILIVLAGNKIIFGLKLISTTHPRTKEHIKVSLLP